MKEELKQETLEEAADLWSTDTNNVHAADSYVAKYGFIKGSKWQSERSYSEEEVLNILYRHTEDMLGGKKVTLEHWFEEFKKK